LGWLSDLLEHFEVVFWLIIVFGSSVASYLKKKNAAQPSPKEDRKRSRPALVDLLPGSQPPQVVHAETGKSLNLKEFLQEAPDEIQDGFPEKVPIVPPLPFSSALEEELKTRTLGNLIPTGPVLGKQIKKWRPRTSWKEAVLLREILGPPRSIAETDIPGLRFK
jgi:hypothetical protein